MTKDDFKIRVFERKTADGNVSYSAYVERKTTWLFGLLPWTQVKYLHRRQTDWAKFSYYLYEESEYCAHVESKEALISGLNEAIDKHIKEELSETVVSYKELTV